MALTIAEILRAVNPNIGLVVNADGSYRIGVEDINSDEILAALLASGVDLAAIEVINTAIQAAVEGTLDVTRTTGALLNSGVLSGDTQVKGSAGDVYWISFSDTAALAFELNNSVGGGGTDLWGLDIPADGYGILIFDPPIEFSTGIYLDVSTGTCKVTVGYK